MGTPGKVNTNPAPGLLCALATFSAAGPAAAALPPTPPTFFVDGGFVVAAERLGSVGEGLTHIRATREDGRTFHAAIGAHAIVKLEPGATAADLARLGLEGERLTDATRLWRVRAKSGVDALDLAASLTTDDARAIVASAVPDYHFERKTSSIDVPPNDPRYGGQWYLDRIAIEEIWAHTTGSSTVTVVVIDNGCDLAHPDLVSKLDPGRDEIDDDDDPSYFPRRRGNEHGTACAGIIGAETNNGLGIAGVCPECRVRCVRLIEGLVPISADVRAFEFAKRVGAAVVSNSWGFTEDIPVPEPLKDAIIDVLDNGRGGLGTVVVFAAGNENRAISDHELAAIRDVVAVGALTLFDEATSFSNRGKALDLVAPVGTLTTDISGADGESEGDYTSNFGGTSSACPVVAGVAGLLASAKPGATAREIEQVLISTTRPAPFAQPGPDGHDETYGWGIVSPGHAVAALLGIEPDAGVDAGDPALDAATIDAEPADAAIADAGVASDASMTTADDGGGCTTTAPATERSDVSGLLALALVSALLRRARRRAAPRASTATPAR
ncbi:S8 family serine peptidase [Myxococcota bacterium]|nr:S8 family serine peptidase [Myxococcota bacterium]